MSDFSKAIPLILKHEGLFSDNPNDPGGPTMYGISLRFLQNEKIDVNKDGKIDVSDVKGMSISEAMKLYYDNFWKKYNYDKVFSQPIATKLLDLSINMGPTTAHKLIQTAVNKVTVETDKVVVDGALGPKSFNAINGVLPSTLMDAICTVAKNHYATIVMNHPNLKPFLKGWLNRARATCGL